MIVLLHLSWGNMETMPKWVDHDMDDATRAYYNVLFPVLNDLEQDAADLTD